MCEAAVIKDPGGHYFLLPLTDCINSQVICMQRDGLKSDP